MCMQLAKQNYTWLLVSLHCVSSVSGPRGSMAQLHLTCPAHYHRVGRCSATGLANRFNLAQPAGLALSEQRFMETYWVDGASITGIAAESKMVVGGLYMMYMDGQGSDDYFDFGYAWR